MNLHFCNEIPTFVREFLFFLKICFNEIRNFIYQFCMSYCLYLCNFDYSLLENDHIP